MENAVDENVVGLLGISNLRVDQLAAILDCARIRPAFVQNRCLAAARWDDEVRALCHAANVVYQGFSLIPHSPDDAVILSASETVFD